MFRSRFVLAIVMVATVSAFALVLGAQPPTERPLESQIGAKDQAEVIQALMAETRALKQTTLDLQSEVRRLEREVKKNVVREFWVAHILRQFDALYPNMAPSYRAYVQDYYRVLCFEYKAIRAEDVSAIEKDFKIMECDGD